MHLIGRTLILGSFAFLACACGGDDDGGGGGMPVDAAVTIDAPETPSPITSGLGKSCTSAQDCANNGTATGCLAAPNMPGFCTQVCVNSGSFMTDNNAQIVPTSIIPPENTWDNASCAASYSGTVGAGVCGFIFGINPADQPLMKNKTYTFQVACAIACGPANECPSGFTCNTDLGICDLP